MSDASFRELVRRLETTSDPSDAKRLLFEALRLGRWLRPNDSDDAVAGDSAWNVNTYRLGTLRYLAWLGWKDALEIMGSLPITEIGHSGRYPVRGGRVVPTAYSEIGPEVAKEVAPTVLAASAAAACMAIAHLVPNLDVDGSLAAYGAAVAARRQYIAALRAPVDRRDKTLIDKLDAASDEVMKQLWRITNGLRPDHSSESREVTPSERAARSARSAWSSLFDAPGRHESDRAEAYASAIFWATYALAWECEPETEPPPLHSAERHALPRLHWATTWRPRRDWRDQAGARASLRCMRVAKAKIRKTMLGPALVAAATLVSQ